MSPRPRSQRRTTEASCVPMPCCGSRPPLPVPVKPAVYGGLSRLVINLFVYLCKNLRTSPSIIGRTSWYLQLVKARKLYHTWMKLCIWTNWIDSFNPQMYSEGIRHASKYLVKRISSYTSLIIFSLHSICPPIYTYDQIIKSYSIAFS